MFAEAILYLAPVLLLAFSLAFGRYPGEAALWSRVARRGRRPRPAPRIAAPPRPRIALVRGGRLLAAALAERGPPAASVPA
jgi:hypothetical protein